MKKIIEMIKKHKIVSIILLVIFIGAIGNLSPKNPENHVDIKANKDASASQNEIKSVNPQFTFDVPSLIGKNIDQVREILGKPSDDPMELTQEQLQIGGANMEWSNSFEKDGKNLLVTYESKTRKIIDFFISTDDSSGFTKNKDHLMELGNLNNKDPKYSLEFVKALKDPSSFTGVKITSK